MTGSTARAEQEQPADPGPASAGGGRVVLGVDDTPGGRAALRWAVSRARAAGVPLLAVRSWELGLPRHGGRRRLRLVPARHPHVVLYFDGFEQRESCARTVSRAFRVVAGGVPGDVTVTVRTPEGDPGQVLAAVAGDRDLIVLGHDRGRGLRRLRSGSVAGYCRGHARCPVVVVPVTPADEAADAAGESR
jgi:nucleotide-binding universal stress UspA family protein